MSGGTFVAQNKIRPGAYINVSSEPKPLGTVGDRGTATLPFLLSWGEPKKIVKIHANDNLKEILGYDITDPKLLLVREALKRAKTLLLYRLNSGEKASATHGTLTIKAKYGGTRGNDITIVVQSDIDDSTTNEVITFVAGQEVDKQKVVDVEGLKPNAWVDFFGSGKLTVTAGVPLTGGTDGTATNQDHADYLTAIEVEDFNTIGLPSSDAILKALYVGFVKRLREQEGRKVQAVLANYPNADYEGIISVKNGVILSDGTKLDSVQATAWVAGATAGAEMNKSLTHQAYDDAVDVDVRYTNSQIEEALKKGEFVFVQNKGRAIVEQDINTLTSFTPKKGKAFSKNRVIRTLDGLHNDYKRIFETFYIGNVDSNDDGRNLLRKECIHQAELYQNMSALQNFDSKTDIRVLPGEETDSVYIEVYVQPVDSVEKVYMEVQVR